jgi:hypothetical protein
MRRPPSQPILVTRGPQPNIFGAKADRVVRLWYRNRTDEFQFTGGSR